MSLGLWLLASIALAGVGCWLFVTTRAAAASAPHPLAFRARLARNGRQLEVIVEHLGNTKPVSITSISVDRAFSASVGLHGPAGFRMQPFAPPARSEHKPDLDEIASSGVELSDEVVEREAVSQFAPEQKMIRHLNDTTVHYVGCIAVPLGETATIAFLLSHSVPATGKLLFGYSYRLGSGRVDSTLAVRVIISDDPNAEEAVSANDGLQTTVTLRLPTKASEERP